MEQKFKFDESKYRVNFMEIYEKKGYEVKRINDRVFRIIKKDSNGRTEKVHFIDIRTGAKHGKSFKYGKNIIYKNNVIENMKDEIGELFLRDGKLIKGQYYHKQKISHIRLYQNYDYEEFTYFKGKLFGYKYEKGNDCKYFYYDKEGKIKSYGTIGRSIFSERYKWDTGKRRGIKCYSYFNKSDDLDINIIFKYTDRKLIKIKYCNQFEDDYNIANKDFIKPILLEEIRNVQPTFIQNIHKKRFEKSLLMIECSPPGTIIKSFIGGIKCIECVNDATECI